MLSPHHLISCLYLLLCCWIGLLNVERNVDVVEAQQCGGIQSGCGVAGCTWGDALVQANYDKSFINHSPSDHNPLYQGCCERCTANAQCAGYFVGVQRSSGQNCWLVQSTSSAVDVTNFQSADRKCESGAINSDSGCQRATHSRSLCTNQNTMYTIQQDNSGNDLPIELIQYSFAMGSDSSISAQGNPRTDIRFPCDCQYWCDQNYPNCKAWVFSANDNGAGKPHCWLKSSPNGSLNYHNDRIWGLPGQYPVTTCPWAVNPGLDYASPNLQVISDTSLEHCCSSCTSAGSSCVAFVYGSSTRKCYLKSSGGSNNIASYVRVAGINSCGMSNGNLQHCYLGIVGTTAPETVAPPTTAAPSTVAPTTAAPTTAAPTTAAPSTAAPSTAAPSTAVPSTAAPTTADPTTAAPTTTSPTTSPTTSDPSTVSPTTTAVPSTTVPSTVVPSTSVPSTAVPSTSVPSSTASPSTAAPSTVVPTLVPSTGNTTSGSGSDSSGSISSTTVNVNVTSSSNDTLGTSSSFLSSSSSSSAGSFVNIGSVVNSNNEIAFGLVAFLFFALAINV